MTSSMSASQSTCSAPAPTSSTGRTLRSCRQNPINYAEITNPMYPTYSRLEGYRDVYNKYMEFCREEDIQPIQLPCFSFTKTDIANMIERGVTSSLNNPSTPVLHLPRFTGELDKKASATLRIFFSRDETQDIFDIDEEIWIDRQQTYFSKLFPQKFKALLSLSDDEVELYNDLCAFEQEKDPDARDNEEDEGGRRRNSQFADMFEAISNENDVNTNPLETNTTKRHVGILLKCLCKKLATRLAFTSREVQMYNKICNTKRMSGLVCTAPKPSSTSAQKECCVVESTDNENCTANIPVVDLTGTTQNSNSNGTSSNENTLATTTIVEDESILEIIGELDACVNGNDDDDNCSEYREEDDFSQEQPPKNKDGDDYEEEEDGNDGDDAAADDDDDDDEENNDDDETLCMDEDEILEAQKEAKKLEKEIIQPNQADAKSHGTDSFVVPDDFVEEEGGEKSDGNDETSSADGDDDDGSDEDDDFSDLVEEEEENSLISVVDTKKRPATSDHGKKSSGESSKGYPRKKQKKSDKNVNKNSDDDDDDDDDSTE